MNSKANPIFSAAAIVFGFWWIFFTLRDFSMSPLEMIRNWAYIGYSLRMWVIGLFVGVGAAAWWIWWKRASAHDRLRGTREAGMVSTLGRVPLPLAPPPRAGSEKERLPLNAPLVKEWIERNKEENPEHLALFLAVWDIYSKHKNWPASHRAGGHGGRMLWQHCLAVAETALKMAPAWKFEGVHVKVRGRRPKLIIAPSRSEFVFDAEDPLIAILALAHDIGKLEAYQVKPDGSVTTMEQGTSRDHDDVGIHHDYLGARILARLPEFWALPPVDRRILNLVIAHYHHPSAFPVDKHGLSLDDRMTSLLEFLILADRRTGMEESGLTQEDEDNELTEEATEELYRAFVEIVTEHGRINGIHGDASKDKSFMIGSKHDGLIVVQERPLRMLLLAKLGQSLEEGDAKYRVTRNLLNILQEKGLLYTQHNGIDFVRYAPMWEISQRRTKDGGHICSWTPVIIFKPTNTSRELEILVSLAEKKARLRIERPVYTHNPNIRDVAALRALVAQAFDPEIASSVVARVSSADESAAPSPASAQATPLSAADPVVASGAPAAVAPLPEPTPAPSTSQAHIQPAAPAVVPVAPAPQPPAAAPVAIVVDLVAPATATALGPVTAAPTSDGAEAETQHAPADLADDLPTIGSDDLPDPGADSDETVDLGMGEGAGEDLGSAGDMFDDFPEAASAGVQPAVAAQAPADPPPAPAPTPSRVDTLKSPRDAALVAQLKAETGPLLVDAPGARAIKDDDAPKGRELGRSDKDKEALKALQTVSAELTPLVPGKKKRAVAKSSITIPLLQELVKSGAVPVGGVADGHSWVLARDLQKYVRDVVVDLAPLKLPTRSIAGGVSFIGIPLP